MNFGIFFIAVLSAVAVSPAGPEFAPRFSPGMVIQRDVPLEVEGVGEPGEDLKLSFAGEAEEVKVDENGVWRATLPARPAGGPFRMEISGGRGSSVLDDVLMGDVWVFAGQSNMQMGLGEADEGAEAIREIAQDSRIRILRIPKAAAPEPDDDPGEPWRKVDTETLRSFSAVAGFFALGIREEPSMRDVPLGLIDSSFGGTAIEAWIPGGVPDAFPEDKVSGSMFGISPAHLYNRMVAPLTALPVKGVVWYQGEANAGHPDVYPTLLKALIAGWRKSWKQNDLPFLVVQLPAFEGRMGGLDFTWLREAQAAACEATPRAWCAVTYDTTGGFDLHPREKREIGRRLSLLARKEVHGAAIVAHGPRMRTVSVSGNRMTVEFDRNVRAKEGAVKGFSLAGENGEYHYALAAVEGNCVTLHADGIERPKTVRYAWGGLTDANLVGESGLPVAPFRTDGFQPEAAAFQPLPISHRIETPAFRLDTAGGGVASLVAGGRQFLSNEPGGGTRIPGFLGPRHLGYTTLVGPRRIILADGEVKLEIACADTSMDWTIRNGSGGEIEFQIALGDRVAVGGEGDAAELVRDDVKIQVEGVSRSKSNPFLVRRVPARDSAVIRWDFGSR